MRHLPAFVAAVGSLAALVVTAPPAHAQLLDKPVPLTNACKLTPQQPYPVVIVHGQAGFVEGMRGVIDRLTAEGYCVYGTNYGLVPGLVGGANGQDHLWTSAKEISAFINSVLAATGTKKVEVVGHSAGTGVLDNYIQQQGGAPKVHSFVSFGGLHHPYWHLGLATFADIDIHLPNLLKFGQRYFPGITIEEITDVIASMVGDPGLAATIKSPFVEDLFDDDYWITLQGASSEPPGLFVKIMTQGRTFPTVDSVPGICNTNIIALGDMLVAASTGWQDVNLHMDNFLTTSVVTGNTHNDQLGNPDALDEMIKGIRRDCGNGAAGITTHSEPLLGIRDEPSGESKEAMEANRKKRQDEFAQVFLKAVDEKYGAVLPRSDVPFPGSDGDSNSDASSGQGAGACSVGSTRDGRGAIPSVLGALGLVFAWARRKAKTIRG